MPALDEDPSVYRGSKALTTDNFLDPDPAAALFVRLGLGGPVTITSQEWTSLFLSIAIREPAVPAHVRRLFGTAIGALVYGYFFYPLYTLGLEQLLRVSETAATARCRSIGFEPKRFIDAINHLEGRGVLTPTTAQRWNALRQLRNSASHPDDQMLLPPGEAAALARRMATQIDALFGH
jgi:hypothetical protein